jgi:hypothetical protein
MFLACAGLNDGVNLSPVGFAVNLGAMPLGLRGGINLH